MENWELAKSIRETNRKLDRLLDLWASLITRDENQYEGVRILSAAGFAPKDIARLLVTTPNTVSVTIATLRREGQLPKAKKK